MLAFLLLLLLLVGDTMMNSLKLVFVNSTTTEMFVLLLVRCNKIKNYECVLPCLIVLLCGHFSSCRLSFGNVCTKESGGCYLLVSYHSIYDP